MANLNKTRLEQLGVYVPERFNSTRLKERILQQCPALHASKKGRDVILAFEDDISSAIHYANENSRDSQAIYLEKAAQVIRKEVLSKKHSFNGRFSQHCQEEAVPDTLLALVNMIIDGSSINDQGSCTRNPSKAALTIAQLLIFNKVKHRGNSEIVRHNSDRETPLAIFIGLLVYSQTRSAKLNALNALAISISYKRVLSLITSLGNSVGERFQNDGLVCPPELKRNIFTTACVDNIDHNPSSRTAKESFHGTAISLTQHRKTEDEGIDRGIVIITNEAKQQKYLSELPESYVNISPSVLKKKNVFAENAGYPLVLEIDSIDCIPLDQLQWLNHVQPLYNSAQIRSEDNISWSAYHASRECSVVTAKAITSQLPLFRESAHQPAMIEHSMKLVKNLTAY